MVVYTPQHPVGVAVVVKTVGRLWVHFVVENWVASDCSASVADPSVVVQRSSVEKLVVDDPFGASEAVVDVAYAEVDIQVVGVDSTSDWVVYN